MSVAPRTTQGRATLADLIREPGKAELIDGRIVRYMPTGFRPGRIAFRIAQALDQWALDSGHGVALGDNVGFAVPRLASGRETFSPDAAYYVGPIPDDALDFVPGPPTFAVEVRSKTEQGPAAEVARAAKRADYFEAGTLLVWDVDTVADQIHSYRHDAPDHPTIFARGVIADAEPAVPGWRVEVEGLFR